MPATLAAPRRSSSALPTEQLPTFALSIRMPWAWLIIRPDLLTSGERLAARHAGHFKDVENRSWPYTPDRFGRIAIHAARAMSREDYVFAVRFVESHISAHLAQRIPSIQQLEQMQGGILGTAEIAGYSRDCSSPWYVGAGALGILLADPRPTPFIRCRGALGMFRIPTDTPL